MSNNMQLREDITTRHRQAQFTISPYHGRDNKKQSRPSLINWVMSPTESISETALVQGGTLKFRAIVIRQICRLEK